jgi:glutamate-ammonia-ligase adenylyltransferase
MAGALSALVVGGLLAAEVEPAFALLSRLLIASRLLAPDGAQPPASPCAVLAKACGTDDWGQLMAAVTDARHIIARAWAQVFGEQMEIDA